MRLLEDSGGEFSPPGARTWMVPLKRVSRFVGRETELEELRQALFTGDQDTRVAVTGPYGIGKTALVLELVYRIRDEYQGFSVFWIPATNRHSIRRAYLMVAGELGISITENDKASVEELVQNHLSSESASQWLMVFDDTEDIDMWTDRPTPESVRLIDCLPKSNSGAVIFTTRNYTIASELAGNVVQVSVLDEAASKQLLYWYGDLNDHKRPVKQEDATTLLRSLNYHPLSIVLAMNYIKTRRLDLRQYLSLLKNGDVEELYDPWMFPRFIRLTANYENQDNLKKVVKSHSRVLGTHNTNVGSNPPLIVDSMASLADTYRAERRLEEAEKLQLQVLEARKKQRGPDDTLTLCSMDKLADMYNSAGRLEEAEKLQLQVLETRKKQEGPDHYMVLNSMDTLADTYKSAGRWEDAAKLQLQVLETRKKQGGPDDYFTSDSMARLADTYKSAGRWEDAAKLQLQVLKAHKKYFGPASSTTFGSMSKLADTYLKAGHFEEAADVILPALESYKIERGPGQVFIVDSLTRLADTYQAEGYPEEAEQLKSHLREIDNITFGAGHPLTVASMKASGTLYEEKDGTLESQSRGAGKIALEGNQRGPSKRANRAILPLENSLEYPYAPEDRGSDCKTDLDIILSEESSRATTNSSIGKSRMGYSGIKKVSKALLTNPELKSLYIIAIQRVNETKCRPYFKSFLEAYADSLKKEAKDHLDTEAAKFIESMAGHISDEIRRAITSPEKAVCFQDGLSMQTPETELATIKATGDVKRDGGPRKERDSSDGPPKDLAPCEDHNDISEPGEDDIFELIEVVERFILSATAIETLITDMSSWLEVDRKQIGTLVDLSIGHKNNMGCLDKSAATKSDVRVEDPLLLSITNQLQSTDPGQIWVTSEVQWSISNHLKGIIEDFWGESWIWWPLAPRARKIPIGKTRLHWICGCGRERAVDVPSNIASQVIQTGEEQTSSLPQSNKMQMSPTYTSSLTGSDSSASTGRTNIPSESDSASEKAKDLHVFFVVASGPRIGDEHYLAQKKIDVGISTDDFFKWLRDQYLELRGSFRSFLSIRIYSHCDFYMFHKWDADMYGPAEQHSFPDSNLPYQYFPKPMSPIPPITEDQFYHRFYTCYQPTTFHKLFHRCRKRCTDRVTLNRLPLRLHRLQVEDNKEEYFWGIYAVTRISCARVMVYCTLCFSPSTLFFFLWLFSWGHQADLQNAAVPLGLSFALLAFLLSFVNLNAASSRGRRHRTKEKED